jgi:hypothetical protein
MKKMLIALTLVLAVATMAQAAPILIDLGTAPPPAVIGGVTMTAFPADGRPLFDVVTGVASPLGGTVGFTPSADHRVIGGGWATWSHGYTGDVYYTLGATSMTLSMPALTTGFRFYVEPNPFSTFSFTISSGGTSGVFSIDGSSGARGFAFIDPLGLGTITISSDIDFAFGEFGIGKNTEPTVPEPGSSLVLLGLGLAGLAWRKRA